MNHDKHDTHDTHDIHGTHDAHRTHDTHDAYLWDGSGPADADIQRLEDALRPLKHRAQQPQTAPTARADVLGTTALRAVHGSPNHHHRANVHRAPPRPRRLAPPFLALAALVALAATLALWTGRSPTAGPAWSVASLQGAPTIESRAIQNTGHLRVGQWLRTDDNSRAQLQVASLGSVTVEEGSRLRLVRAADNESRLELARGRIQAFIVAPPRLFFVDTPGAVAADLGCAYTLAVGDDGAGELRVTIGWVELDRRNGLDPRNPAGPAHISTVPAGAVCRMDPKLGPGTPHFADSTPEFIGWLNKLDAMGADTSPEHAAAAATAVSNLITLAGARDSLSLWHLLSRVTGPTRERVYDRLAQIVPPPAAATRSAVLALDQGALDAWWMAVRQSW